MINFIIYTHNYKSALLVQFVSNEEFRLFENFSSNMDPLQKKLQLRNEHRIHVKRLMTEMPGLNQGDVVDLKTIEKSLRWLVWLI